MQETLRTRKVAELIRQEVSRIIRDQVNDPKVKNVVITAVKVTRDLDLARIFFTTYIEGSEVKIKAGLDRSSGFIHKELVRSIRMKKVPRLEFVIDNSKEEATKIDSLLSLIEKTDSSEEDNDDNYNDVYKK